MVVNIIKPNIQDLKQNVIDLLEEISELMGEAKNTLSSDPSSQKFAEFEQEIKNTIVDVRDLELRMAVVAPMKAGKSTIVNAIIGQDLLPSRNAAMTTLPTEIVFNANIEKPVLILGDRLRSVLQDTYNILRKKIRFLEEQELLQQTIAQYPHLTDLIAEIKEEVGFLAESNTSGSEEITQVLKSINDLVRLGSVLDPTLDILTDLREIPRLETPFCRSQGDDRADRLGNLVIIDTPGPNEAGENLKLTSVVADQLRRSSIVLIVLDFTQLSSKAAEDVKQQVQPIIDLLGKENLYVLVNKVDQRRSGDMTPEEVKEFVFADLNLSDSNNTDRVFEVAARRAFSATKFMLELQQNPDVNLSEMQTVEGLAQEALGARWKSKLQKASLQELQEEAEYLWQDSGFAPFLEQAIGALMENAAPRCLLTSLKLSYRRLSKLRDDVKLRSTAIASDEQKLKVEIDALEADLNSLDSCRQKFQEVEQIRGSLQLILKEIVELLQKEAQVSMEDYFLEEDYQQGDILKKMDIRAREIFLTDIPFSNVDLFPKWMSKISSSISSSIKSKLKYKISGVAEFKNEREAEEFANQAIAWARQRADNLLIGFREQTEEEILKAQTNLINFLDRETRPIIEQALQRLNQNFDIKLSPPPLNLEIMEDADYLRPQINKQARQLVNSKIVKERPWYFLGLVEKRKQVEVTRTENFYNISLQDLVDRINQSIEKNVDTLNASIDRYLDEDFKQRVDDYFAALDGYLCNYRNSLIQAQIDQQLSLEEKKKLVDELNSLLPASKLHIKRAADYFKVIKEYSFGEE
jgi:GTPase SAR1 family protein